MSLQNRVLPTGDIVAMPARGTFLGNRGGRFHDPASQRLKQRHWASKQWICCLLSFKGRHRPVMGRGYTELFFLDEVTALAAGHRPCFECRRTAADAFAQAWAHGHDLQEPPRAPEMDKVLHEQRLIGQAKRTLPAKLADLPDGAMFQSGEDLFAWRDGAALPWSPQGYGPAEKPSPATRISLLTPPAITAALRAGYRPEWHGTASLRI